MLFKYAKMLPPAYKINFHLMAIELILFCFIGVNSAASQPPYQVALYVTLHPHAPPLHYCNGIILHSRLILTTASCTYYQSSYVEQKPVRIESSMISVVPGYTIAYNILNTFDVLEIKIAPSFNSTILANNLALLRLDTSLPLGRRDDVQWIILDDYNKDAKGSYMAGFPSINVDQSVMLLENVQILQNEQCAPIIRNGDICGRYPYAVGPDCEFPADFRAFNSDYGTGLIIHSRLVALFSRTILTNPNQNCHDHTLKAIYTAVGPHLDWIYGIIAKEELLALNQNGFIHSAPYQQRGSSAIKFTTDATESTTTTTTTTAATTTTTAISNASTTAESSSYPSTVEVNLLPSASTSGALAVVDMKYAPTFSSLFLLISVYV